jgi:hypothetical protein
VLTGLTAIVLVGPAIASMFGCRLHWLGGATVFILVVGWAAVFIVHRSHWELRRKRAEEKMSAEDLDFGKEHRWDLTSASLKRSDESGTVLRSLLFTLCASAIGFTLSRNPHTAADAAAAVSFAAALALVVMSWDVQKRKAGDRYSDLLKYGYDRFSKQHYGIPNHIIDRLSYLFVVVGVVFEFWAWIGPIQAC